eukprot:COSAG01_NODE_4669_length_4833_cov_2.424377_5_plen_266_part_00
MREHRAAAAAAQAPPPSVAAASSGPGSEPLGRGGSADYGPNKIGEVSGRHIEEEEPVGSFRRRFDAQARLMDGLTKSRQPGKAQPASGVQWGQLRSGLAALFESRSRASRGGRSRKGIAQYRISAAAQMPGPRQKALERRIGDLNDHYELGSGARILNEVDRTFVKRQRCPACHSCGECRPGCSLKGRGGARNNPFAPQLDGKWRPPRTYRRHHLRCAKRRCLASRPRADSDTDDCAVRVQLSRIFERLRRSGNGRFHFVRLLWP